MLVSHRSKFFPAKGGNAQGYMNIAMENTEELVNGVAKNSFGDAFIRGNNGTETRFCLTYESNIARICTVLYISRL